MDKPTSAKRDVTPYAFAVAGVLFASICFGFVPYFSRGLTDQDLAPYAVAFYRYILAAIVLLPALLKHRSKWRRIHRSIVHYVGFKEHPRLGLRRPRMRFPRYSVLR